MERFYALLQATRQQFGTSVTLLVAWEEWEKNPYASEWFPATHRRAKMLGKVQIVGQNIDLSVLQALYKGADVKDKR